MVIEGFNKCFIGKVSMVFSEGLVGLVGICEELFNLENVVVYLCYCYFVEIGEECYVLFFGVLIIYYWWVMGVLVV